jgi:hypothetical protein
MGVGKLGRLNKNDICRFLNEEVTIANSVSHVPPSFKLFDNLIPFINSELSRQSITDARPAKKDFGLRPRYALLFIIWHVPFSIKGSQMLLLTWRLKR